MKEKIKEGLKILVFLFLSIVLLYLAFRKVDLGEVWQQIKEAEYSWILISFAFSIIAFFSRARRWILIIIPLGHKPRLWSTYHALLTGYLVNFGFPRLGEITRCVALGRKEKIGVDKLVGTVIAERAFDFLSLLIILFFMLILRNDLMASFLRNDVIIPVGDKIAGIFGSAGMFFLISALLILAATFLLFLFRSKLAGFAFFRKISGLFKGIFNGLRAFARIEHKLEFILHTIIIWTSYTLMTWVIVFMIPATSGLGLVDGIFLLVTGSLAMAAPVQGGIGAFHWMVSRGLFVVYNIPLADGLVYATLSHESQLILIAVLGTFSIFKIFGGKKVKLRAAYQPEAENGQN